MACRRGRRLDGRAARLCRALCRASDVAGAQRARLGRALRRIARCRGSAARIASAACALVIRGGRQPPIRSRSAELQSKDARPARRLCAPHRGARNALTPRTAWLGPTGRALIAFRREARRRCDRRSFNTASPVAGDGRHTIAPRCDARGPRAVAIVAPSPASRRSPASRIRGRAAHPAIRASAARSIRATGVRCRSPNARRLNHGQVRVKLRRIAVDQYNIWYLAFTPSPDFVPPTREAHVVRDHAPLRRAESRVARQAVDRRRIVDQRIPGPAGLARQREREPGLFARRPDPERVRQGDRELLAEPRLPERDRRSAPQCGSAHPRSRRAVRLLRGLVAAHAAQRRVERRARQGRVGAAEAHVERGRPDRELPRHAAERMGGRAGVQLVRHVHGAVRAPRRAHLRRSAPVRPGTDLQPERAVTLGHADAVHEPDVRLDLPRGSARASARDRRRRDAVHVRRSAARNGHDQPGVHRGDAGGRRGGPRVHVPDSDLQHHRRFRLAQPERRAPVRDDRALRPAVLPELHQFRVEAEHDPLDVLPAAARPARADEARQRAVRLGRADGIDRRGHRELRAARLSARGRRARALRAARHAARLRQGKPRDQARGDPASHEQRALPVHEALSRHAAQSFLDARRERHQRDDPQFHARRARSDDRLGPRVRAAPARPRARAHRRVSGGNGPHVQPRGDAGRGHDVPLREGRPPPLSGHPAGGHAADAVLHELVAVAGRLHRRSVRGARTPGRPAAQIHGRHGAASVHDRAAVVRRRVPHAREARAHPLLAAVSDRHADLLDLPDARLSRRQPPVLPEVRRSAAASQIVSIPTDGSLNMTTTLQANPQAARAAIVLSDDERQPCEIWTRVMGYHRPVSSFNVGKQGEFHERKYFRERATDEAALRAAA
ncbi:Conserved hypothetical protein [Burkholderia pseudomallei 1710b]|uniref:Uncharacterized protein n=7 Tax=pseudomallei group TaxID=111527 RepID=Q3JQG1_BURP1|nr:Conserved hypothetical protein [Burkholderia pseudomallei 1710b]